MIQGVVHLSSNLYGLVGNNESYADTIRRLLERNASSLTGVAFISEGGINEGGETITGTVAAHADILAKSDSNTYIRLQFRTLGTDGNDWVVQLRRRAVKEITVNTGNNKIRIDFVEGQTMQDVLTDIYASTDMQAIVAVASLNGAHLLSQEPAVATYPFEGGEDDTTNRDQELTSGDMAFFEAEQMTFVKTYDGNIVTIEANNQFIYQEAIVYVDIFGSRAHNTNRSEIIKVRDAIDAIIQEHVNGPYQKSGSAGNSAIIQLGAYSIDWTRISETTDDGITESLHGELPVRIQRNLS